MVLVFNVIPINKEGNNFYNNGEETKDEKKTTINN